MMFRLVVHILCIIVLFKGISIAKSLTTPPNIVVFLVDDMGWQDTSVPFWNVSTPLNKRYQTPNMERMALKGMKLTSAYAMSVCTPTRVSLLTGVNAVNHRVTHWTNPQKDINTDYPDSLYNSVDWNINGLSPEPDVPHTYYATPLPILLKQRGYKTILTGKAHFGSLGTPGADPLNLGFDVSIAGSSIGHPASYYGKDNYDRPVNGKPNKNAVPGLEAYHGSDVFLTDALTFEALKAVDNARHNQQPFFLYLSHYAVHTPLQSDPRFVDKYLKQGLEPIEANYASLVEGMDKSLGEVLDYLDQHQLSENTLILFMSDNGGLSTPPLRGGEGYTHNLPLRAGKGSVYEGGIRVPMLAQWKGKIKPSSVTEQPIIVEDVFATIVDVAGIKNARTVQSIDGHSFQKWLVNPTHKMKTRSLIWHHPHKWIPDQGPAISWASAYRKGDWKLVYDYPAAKLELYNLKEDIGETLDRALDKPAVLKKMVNEFTQHLKKSNAQMPTVKSTGQSIPYPNELIGTPKRRE